MNALTSQNFNRLAQIDRSKGLELKLFDQPSLFHSETELSLSEAAQRIERGETVTIEEASKSEAQVSYTQWGKPKEGVVTITQRMRTHLESARELDQFVHLRDGVAPSGELEALASRLLPLEGHIDGAKQEAVSLANVKEGFFGGRSVEDGPGLSAFEAARRLQNQATIAITGVPVLAMVEGLFSGNEDKIRDQMKIRYISSPSDLGRG